MASANALACCSAGTTDTIRSARRSAILRTRSGTSTLPPRSMRSCTSSLISQCRHSLIRSLHQNIPQSLERGMTQLTRFLNYNSVTSCARISHLPPEARRPAPLKVAFFFFLLFVGLDQLQEDERIP